MAAGTEVAVRVWGRRGWDVENLNLRSMAMGQEQICQIWADRECFGYSNLRQKISRAVASSSVLWQLLLGEFGAIIDGDAA